MSINRRTAIAVRSIGVASAAAALALGVAGSAFACQISDFTDAAVCDSGKASITVTDKDGSHTKAEVSLYIELNSPGQERLLDTKTIERPTAEGVTISFDESWSPGTTYRVHIKAGQSVDADISPNLTTPDKACEAPAPPADNPPPPADNPPPPKDDAPPSTKPTATTPAPAAVADTNAPSPAGGTSNLAETGGGSNTGMIAGVAAVLVAAGGGTVFMLRRRNPAGRH